MCGSKVKGKLVGNKKSNTVGLQDDFFTSLLKMIWG